MFYLVLQDDGGFWIDGNEPNEPYIRFLEWGDAYKTGMQHRQKFDKPKHKGKS